MRRMIATATAVLVLAALVAAGCGRGSERAESDVAPAGVREAEVYEQVLRRYLTTSNENSFSEKTFKAVFVLDQAHVNAGDPDARKKPGVPIPLGTQTELVAALASTATLEFIADSAGVVLDKDGCARVKDDGILITLGTIEGDDKVVVVGISGFVACMGATWLTYVVHNPTGTGWTVKGTTGHVTVA